MKALLTNLIIPEEELCTWQPWLPDVLDNAEVRGGPAKGRAMPQQSAPVSAPVKAIGGYPTAAELEAVHHEAWKAGHADGLAAGHEQGYQAGLLEGQRQGKETAQRVREQEARLTEQCQLLNQMMQQLMVELKRFESDLAQDVLSLAYTLAQQLAGQSIQIQADCLKPLLQQAITELPEALSQARLRAHPDDLLAAQTFLQHELPDTQWQWIEDSQIERGGCILETSALRLDLTRSMRAAILRRALGIESDGNGSL